MNQRSRNSKTSKRGHYEGSVQRTEYGTWRVWVTLRSGKRVSKSLPSKAEAREWMQQRMTEDESPARDEQLYGDYLKEWFETHALQVKESTRSDYEIIIKKYILPHLSDFMLKDLHRSVFDKYYTTLQKSGVGETQIRYVQRVVHKSLSDAVQDHVLPYNPSQGAKTPRKQQRSRVSSPLSEEQSIRMLAVAMQYSIGPMIHLAIKTGMRQGELFALMWKDINWETHQIHVRRNLQRYMKGEKMVREFCSPKTMTSVRVITVGDQTIAVLQEQEKWVRTLQTFAGKRWHDNDLVFPTNVGTPMNPSNIRKRYLDILDEAEVPRIRFHDLRHIAASIMLNHGIPLLTVSAILGHAQPSTTLNMYGHQFTAMDLQAACLVDDIFSKSMPSPLPAELTSLSNLKK